MIIALENIRSLFNIGAILRTAEFFGFKEIALIGYSGIDINEPDLIHAKLKKTALSSIQHLNITHYENVSGLINIYPKHEIICIENNVPNTLDIIQIDIKEDSIIIFGNEIQGIEPSTLNLADKIYEIKRYGNHASLNVETTVGITLHQIKNRLNKI